MERIVYKMSIKISDLDRFENNSPQPNIDYTCYEQLLNQHQKLFFSNVEIAFILWNIVDKNRAF